MDSIYIKEIDSYIMEVKEINFQYKNLRFAYILRECPSYTESEIKDLNALENKLSENELNNLKSKLEEYDLSELEPDDEL